MSVGGENVSPARRKIRWRWGVLAALALALVSLYPQMDLWRARGADWQGAFASGQHDELIYAAYINGLILGSPRLTEPLATHHPAKQPHESLFSIQIVPAYLIAIPARAFGLSAAQAFILLTPLMAFLATLALFYLLAMITRDEGLAVVGALAILVFGAPAAKYYSVISYWLGWSDCLGDFLFLRRYQPSVAFPLFFIFVALIWRAFTQPSRQAAITAGVVFAVLVFSYFFLWTAAVAWLTCFTMVWLVARYSEWPMLLKRLAPTAIIGVGAVAVYAVMLSHRDRTMDKVQALVLTHAPDLYRVPQLIALLSLLLLFWAVRKGRTPWREPVVLLAASLALMPLAVFNQQIITGHSLQPIHYESLIANYVSLLAAILILIIAWRGHEFSFPRQFPKFLAAGLAGLLLIWGTVEMYGVTMVYRQRNIESDLFVPVAKRLTALAAEHGKDINNREVVFSPDTFLISDHIAVHAPQVPLWSTYVPVASNLSLEEDRERYFQYLYYSGLQPGSLGSKLASNDFTAVSSLFGYERFMSELATESKPITTGEIREKVEQYGKFVETFDRERYPELSYVVTYAQASIDFSNLDRWYVRGQGEHIGPFTLYQVKLR